MIPFIQQLLSQNDKLMRLSEQSMAFHYDMLREFQSKKPQQLESVIEAELVRVEGGIRQVNILHGAYRMDVYQPGVFMIEVKHWKRYAEACEQIKKYAYYMDDVDAEMRVHLFTKPFESKPTGKRLAKLQKECRRSGVVLTWHDWGSFEPRKEKQQFLALN
jgi:hypothetical protein